MRYLFQKPLPGMVAAFCAGLFVPSVSANCLLLHDMDRHGHWIVTVDSHVGFANFDGSDEYFSGDYMVPALVSRTSGNLVVAGGDEDWRASHDLDGTIYGMSLRASPPLLGNMFTVFLSYANGTLDGDFNTREVSPFPEGPYHGRVSYDRDEFEVGVDVQILNAVYGRLAYSRYEMDGDWRYFGGFDPREPQEYQFEAFELGVGFRQDFVSCYSPRLSFGVDAYLAVLFFDYEHKEVDGGRTADSDGAGFKGRLEANAKYALTDHTRAVVGVGYLYQSLDDDGIDLTDDGLFIRLGVEASF